MKTGIRASNSTTPQTELIGEMTESANNPLQTELINIMTENSKIPPYASNFKKEYLYIRGLNNDSKYFLNRLDNINNGLFETKSSNRIKYNMKRFLRAQEKGKLNDISSIMFQRDDVQNFIYVNENFDLYKQRYDAFCEDSDYNDYFSDDDSDDDGDGEYLVDGKPYPGFIEIYDIFKMIFNQLKYEDFDSSDDDSDCDSRHYDDDFSNVVFPDTRYTYVAIDEF